MNKVFTRELVAIFGAVGVAVLAMAFLQPMLPLYLTSIGIEPAVMGLMFSTAMLGMVLGESSGGWLADRAGARVPLSVGTFLCAPLVLLFIFARSTAAIFVVFFFWGIVRAAIFGPGRGYIGTHVPVAHRAMLIAVYSAAMGIARSAGSFASGYIQGAWDYRGVFIVSAGVSVLAGLVVLAGVRRKKAIAASAAASSSDAPSMSVKDLVRHRPFVSQCVIAALFFCSMSIGPFVPLLAADLAGLSIADVGILLSIGAIISTVVVIPMGRIADRWNKRALMFIGLLVVVGGLVGIAFSRTFATIALSGAVQSLGGAMFGPAAVSLLSEVVPASRQNTAMGIYGGCEDAGVIVGSALGGFAWAGLGPLGTFVIVGATSATIGAVLCLTLLRAKAPAGGRTSVPGHAAAE